MFNNYNSFQQFSYDLLFVCDIATFESEDKIRKSGLSQSSTTNIFHLAAGVLLIVSKIPMLTDNFVVLVHKLDISTS